MKSIAINHSFFFFFNDTATTEIYTLSLHDALPISPRLEPEQGLVLASLLAHQQLERPVRGLELKPLVLELLDALEDRKSTRLNSSHLVISYAVFCLKKKKKNKQTSNLHHTTHSICT